MSRILFVDDEQRLLDGLRQSLRSKRKVWDMAFANGGAAALRELERTQFDVVVSDMRMPGMDGAELLARVAALQPRAVRVVLSGQMDENAAARSVTVAHRFLAKPCESEKLIDTLSRALDLGQLLGSERLRECVAGMAALPSLPRTCILLQQVLAAPNTTLGSVSSIIEQDIAMAAKVLQLVNSAFFGLSRKSTNIEQAVSYLGVSTLSNLVLTHSLFTALGHEDVEFMEREQKHGLLVAWLARELSSDPKQGEIASTAGLLHDIGGLALACRLPHECVANNELARSRSVSLHEAEVERLGVSHAGVGAYLLGLWGLPHEVIDAVAAHHEPWANVRQLDACTAVRIAESIAEGLTPSSANNGRPSEPPSEILQRFGLTTSFEALRAKAEAVVASGGSMFG